MQSGQRSAPAHARSLRSTWSASTTAATVQGSAGQGPPNPRRMTPSHTPQPNPKLSVGPAAAWPGGNLGMSQQPPLSGQYPYMEGGAFGVTPSAASGGGGGGGQVPPVFSTMPPMPIPGSQSSSTNAPGSRGQSSRGMTPAFYENGVRVRPPLTQQTASLLHQSQQQQSQQPQQQYQYQQWSWPSQEQGLPTRPAPQPLRSGRQQQGGGRSMGSMGGRPQSPVPSDPFAPLHYRRARGSHYPLPSESAGPAWGGYAPPHAPHAPPAPPQESMSVPLPLTEAMGGDDVLINLLLAWYYSGFYTGLYQGLRR
jgi:hypothetical protein